jgi:hypothetical protein
VVLVLEGRDSGFIAKITVVGLALVQMALKPVSIS